MTAPDIVCPVRERPTEELRYALRSWAAHVPHSRVWLVGYRPRWVSDEVRYIPTSQDGLGKWQATTVAYRATCARPEVSETFTLMNDDFHVMHPLPDGVPLMHQGPMSEVLAAVESKGWKGTGYVDAMRRFVDRFGPYALSFDGHWPMPVGKSAFRKALDDLDGLDHLKRSVYGAVVNPGGVYTKDVKVGHRAPRGYGPGDVFISTMPDSFANGAVGRFIRDRFPLPCQYERAGR